MHTMTHCVCWKGILIHFLLSQVYSALMPFWNY